MMDGVVVIDKPAGKTSHDVVSEVKKILDAKKAGHTGTLDPMATGVLPVCLNEATKLARFFSDEGKEYLATMLLGVKTDTLDKEGKIIGKSDGEVTKEEIKSALLKMVGKIKQFAPAYSAVKYGGQPLYKWARQGIILETAARDAEIYNIDIHDISFPYVSFTVSCSKGTYIRTLCADVGDSLGIGACLSDLRRLKSGFFSEEMAVSLENCAAAGKKAALLGKMLPMTQSLPALAAVEINDDFAAKIYAGIQPTAEMMKAYVLPFLAAGDVVKLISLKGCLVALVEMLVATDNISELEGKREVAKIVRVFNVGKN